ncbi:hypothetical protein BCV69DRAFT_297948 [Microstroma glucosiphilum]|uniref:Uncharacterized protein n=1 Tax=Pseudomicrostroma glucosiphilum TaxID=1684307 RepID=A0A316UBA5_9BASI|nr:hypothetical protein BCV69DRAFT_297948 [Pseudomicrostroma glucosiphilum]PWN21731.1 hypothetical protein BCV69DRAFT_297948 [Pseudomicrostroma glucosiphilum]
MRLRCFTALAVLGTILVQSITLAAADIPALKRSQLILGDVQSAGLEFAKRAGPRGSNSKSVKSGMRVWRSLLPGAQSSSGASSSTPATSVHDSPPHSSPVQHWRSLFHNGPPRTKSQPPSPGHSKGKPPPGKSKSLPASPGSPAWSYHSLSSLGSFRASPDSVKSQPSSPKADEKLSPTWTLTKCKKNTWTGWFKKEKHVCSEPFVKNGALRPPHHWRHMDIRKHKTLFYGKDAKEHAKGIRPSVLRSGPVRQLRERLYNAKQKMFRTYS